jgi:hypothetical protein
MADKGLKGELHCLTTFARLCPLGSGRDSRGELRLDQLPVSPGYRAGTEGEYADGLPTGWGVGIGGGAYAPAPLFIPHRSGGRRRPAFLELERPMLGPVP